MSNTLVLYYSFEGSTKKIAEYIAKEIEADIEKITPVKELKSKGFSKFLWGGSQVIMKKKPEINPINLNLDDYNTVLIGTPIWAGTFAPPIYTLLEEGYLKNKKIGYFYCHEGGAKNAVKKAKESIEKDNFFVSSFSCQSVQKNYEIIKDKVSVWAKEVIKQQG